MDKFAEAFKATIAVFHGIIATWLFLEFSDTKVTEFYFVILLVFFTVANIYVWRLLIAVPRRLYAKTVNEGSAAAALPAAGGLAATFYRPGEIIGLTVVAFAVGLCAAYLQNKQVVLRTANLVIDWQRSDARSPFYLMLTHVSTHTMQMLDARTPDAVAAAKGSAYLRVFMKDMKYVYEGYPGWVPGRLDPQEVILTPACRLLYDPNDATKIVAVQPIEGPGAYLNLSLAASIEIIDAQNACRKQP